MEQNQQQTKSSNTFLAGAIIVAALLIAGALVYSTGNKAIGTSAQALPPSTAIAGVSTTPPPIGGRDAVLGDPKAPIAFIEYGDYQCPFCGRFFKQVEPQLRDEYIKTGKVKMVFRNWQILGQESTDAGAASECAKDQGKFWAYHDTLYTAETADGQENNGNLNRDLFLTLARSIGLNEAAFTSCFDSNKYAGLVKKEMADGQALGLTGTPTSFINGQKIVGAQPYPVFKATIEAALKAGK